VSPRLPALTGRELIAALEWRGFHRVRPSGSHVVLRHSDGRRVTVPIHAGRHPGRVLRSQIMRDAKLTVDDLAG